MTRVAVVSDLHCGHRLGLVPPDYQERRGAIARLQRELWDWYAGEATALRPDVLVVNGDAIDGLGEKSGGTELLTTDRLRQVEIACAALAPWAAERTEVVAGTAYHTGHAEEIESVLARQIGADYHGELCLNAGGAVFHCRHHIGGGQAWGSKAAALLREQEHAVLYAAVGPGGARPDVIVRSHVHWWTLVQNDAGIAVTTPGLQVQSRLGRRLGLWPDVGLCWFDVVDGAVSVQVRRFRSKLLERIAC